jgi:ferritin-like metal-binding protein YciE
MFERLNTAEELYHYKLGAALKMEQTVLEMLDENAQEAQDAKLAELFRHHQDETREHIQNLEKAFGVFGWEVVELLEHNLEQEKHTLEEVRNATHHIAAQKVGSPA